MKIMGRRVVCTQCQRDLDRGKMYPSNRSGTGQGQTSSPVPQYVRLGRNLGPGLDTAGAPQSEAV